MNVSSLINQQGTRAVFDVMGRKVSEHRPETGLTEYRYDKAGRLTETIDAKGQKRSTRYTTFGQVKQRLVNDTVRADYAYDRAGRVSREVDGEGVETRYLYRRDGRLGHTVRQHQDQAYGHFGARSGRQIARQVTRYQYDARGNVTEQSVAKDYRTGNDLTGGASIEAVRSRSLKYVSQWQRKYDHRGRVVSETKGNGVERITEYALGGRVKTVKLSGAVQERIELDAMGRTLSLTNGAGEKTDYEYDDTRRRVTVVSPGAFARSPKRTRTERRSPSLMGWVISAVLNTMRRVKVTRTTFLAKGDDEPQTLSSKQYDAQTGLLTFSTNADGTRTEYRYDSVGRQWKVIRDADGEKLTTTYAYNADGQRISENNEGRVTTLRFDRQGRKVWTEQGGVASAFTYDLNGQVIQHIEGALTEEGELRQERVTEYERDATGAVLEKRVRSLEKTGPRSQSPLGVLSLQRGRSGDRKANPRGRHCSHCV